MAAESIGSLFAKDISRRIEEVIKVDQTDEEVIGDEIAEYVITDSIRSHYDQILDLYWETPKKPHEGIASGCLDSSGLANQALPSSWGSHSRTVPSRAKVPQSSSANVPAARRPRCC